MSGEFDRLDRRHEQSIRLEVLRLLMTNPGYRDRALVPEMLRISDAVLTGKDPSKS